MATDLHTLLPDLDGGVFEQKIASVLSDVAFGVVTHGRQGKVTIEFDMKQIQDWCKKTGVMKLSFVNDDIFAYRNLDGMVGMSTEVHNLETLTEALIGDQQKQSCNCDGCTDGDDVQDFDTVPDHIPDARKMIDGEPIPVPEYGEDAAGDCGVHPISTTQGADLTVQQLIDWCQKNSASAHIYSSGTVAFWDNSGGTFKATIDAISREYTAQDPWPEERVDDGLHYKATDVVPGYECLADVLARALDQASRGKGKERHAQDLPFSEQPMQRLISLYGPGFALGQAAKKAQESQRLPRDRAVAELLGAIVYLAGAIIHLEKGQHDG